MNKLLYEFTTFTTVVDRCRLVVVAMAKGHELIQQLFQLGTILLPRAVLYLSLGGQ